MTKIKNRNWWIIKEVLDIDTSLPNDFAGMKYVIHSNVIDKTERQACFIAEKLENAIPDVDESTRRYQHICYIVVERDWIESIIKNGIFKVEGYNSTAPDYDLMSKEELIKLLMEKK